MRTAEKMRILRALCRQADHELVIAWNQAERERDQYIEELKRTLIELCQQADQDALAVWHEAERARDSRIADLWVYYCQNTGPFATCEELAA